MLLPDHPPGPCGVGPSGHVVHPGDRPDRPAFQSAGRPEPPEDTHGLAPGGNVRLRSRRFSGSKRISGEPSAADAPANGPGGQPARGAGALLPAHRCPWQGRTDRP